ncbi:hypothetical protein EDD11_001824 [Mortierella claussenii]|nr:hypothetical protein EDD11_001824 [Mortierella claussenii]
MIGTLVSTIDNIAAGAKVDYPHTDTDADTNQYIIKRPRKNDIHSKTQSNSISDSGTTKSTKGNISIMSVPIMDPFYQDLQTLRSDYTTLERKLKFAQQSLAESRQDLRVAQDRATRAEAHVGRLKDQMHGIMKRHVDHLPEREMLVQQLTELQARFDLELRSRQALQQEHGVVLRELWRYKAATAASELSMPSSGTRASSAFTSSVVPPAGGSSLSDIPSLSRSMSFMSFLTGGLQKSAGAASKAITTNEQALLMRETEEVLNRALDNDGNCRQDHVQCLSLQSEKLDVLMLTREQEKLKAKRQLYDKIEVENVSMRMELQDLRIRYHVEKDSIKNYMSLFEGIQKKQSNALAVSQSQILSLTSQLDDLENALQARDTLLQQLTSAIASHASGLESLTVQTHRSQIARARTEQEMALLIEASLLMLERWFDVIQQTRSKLMSCLDPVRQKIQLLEFPSIAKEWDQCIKNVDIVMEGMARGVVWQQQIQEMKLDMNQTVDGCLHNRERDPEQQQRLQQKTQQRRSTSSTRSTMSKMTATTLVDHHDDDNEQLQQKAPLVLDNSYSQEIFVWRKFMADSFLEDCVRSVESLAQERRELQVQLLTLELSQRVVGKVAREEEIEYVPTLDQQCDKVSTSPTEPDTDTDIDVSAEEQKSTEGDKVEIDGGNDDPAKRVQRLEAILKRVLEWSDHQQVYHQAKGLKQAPSALDILEAVATNPMPSESQLQEPVVVMRAEIHPLASLSSTAGSSDSVSAQEDLETLAQWIRRELSSQEFSTVSGTDCVAVSRDHERDETSPPSALLSSSSTATPVSASVDSESAPRIEVRPEVTTTLQHCSSALSLYYNSPTTPSLVSDSSTSSFSSSSSSSSESDHSSKSPRLCPSTLEYFQSSSSNSINIAGLAIPTIPLGLGGIGSGPDGKTSVFDLDALCRDLKFKSFPKQHQWSKSRSIAPYSSSGTGPCTLSSLLPIAAESKTPPRH